MRLSCQALRPLWDCAYLDPTLPLHQIFQTEAGSHFAPSQVTVTGASLVHLKQKSLYVREPCRMEQRPCFREVGCGKGGEIEPRGSASCRRKVNHTYYCAVSAVLRDEVFQLCLRSWTAALCSWETDTVWIQKDLTCPEPQE